MIDAFVFLGGAAMGYRDWETRLLEVSEVRMLT